MAKATKQEVVVRPLNEITAQFRIRGNAPYCQNKFSGKAKQLMIETQEAGSQNKKGKKREAKDFDSLYEGAKHTTADGWHGIPAPAFRCALIDSCRTAGFTMTMAKMTVFVKADGFDVEDGTPLVRITKGEPKRVDSPVRNASGVADIRSRPVWDPGWEAVVTVKFDGDAFTLSDVTNLLVRAGTQNGIGEGRPNSKASAGIGWGTFDVVND
jgi:hypothetical protein